MNRYFPKPVSSSHCSFIFFGIDTFVTDTQKSTCSFEGLVQRSQCISHSSHTWNPWPVAQCTLILSRQALDVSTLSTDLVCWCRVVLLFDLFNPLELHQVHRDQPHFIRTVATYHWSYPTCVHDSWPQMCHIDSILMYLYWTKKIVWILQSALRDSLLQGVFNTWLKHPDLGLRRQY